MLARRQGEGGRAIELAAEARSLYAKAGDPAGEAWAIVTLGNAYTFTGDLERAAELAGEGAALAAASSSRELEALITLMGAQTDLSAGRLDEARGGFGRAADLFAVAGMTPESLTALNNLALCALLAGRDDDAESYARASLRRANELGLALHVAWALSALASAAWARDRVAAASALSDEVVAAARVAEANVLVIRVVEDTAAYLARAGRAREAAILAGAAAAARTRRDGTQPVRRTRRTRPACPAGCTSC